MTPAQTVRVHLSEEFGYRVVGTQQDSQAIVLRVMERGAKTYKEISVDIDGGVTLNRIREPVEAQT